MPHGNKTPWGIFVGRTLPMGRFAACFSALPYEPKGGIVAVQAQTDFAAKMQQQEKQKEQVNTMQGYDYFYGQQSELFSFIKIPKALFVEKRFRNISAEAKVLYGILLDRMSLSRKNDWYDPDGRVYIIYPTEEVMESLTCGKNKACQLMAELEKNGLIVRKRLGLGKPSIIYVMNFTTGTAEEVESG